MKGINDAITRRTMRRPVLDAVSKVVKKEWLPYARARLTWPHDSRSQTEMLYTDAEDVRQWAAFLIEMLPDVVATVRRMRR
jgi:hypothetical protein